MKKIIMILCLSYANIVFAVDMITPIPNSISYDKEKAKLGKSLYMDIKFIQRWKSFVQYLP